MVLGKLQDPYTKNDLRNQINMQIQDNDNTNWRRRYTNTDKNTKYFKRHHK